MPLRASYSFQHTQLFANYVKFDLVLMPLRASYSFQHSMKKRKQHKPQHGLNAPQGFIFIPTHAGFLRFLNQAMS